MFQLSKLFANQRIAEYTDDLRIMRNWAEYTEDNSTMRYLLYEMEVEEPDGQIVHLYKALKILRVVRLPKSAKQSEAFMSMHAQILGGVWMQNINFCTIIANILQPKPIGLVFCYGVQGVASTLEGAKKKADMDFAAVQAALQGTYRTLQARVLDYDELEWLREKMFSMKNIVVVRGIPKAKDGGVDAGTSGIGGENINPDSEDTTEEFIAGMVDHEYVVQVLSTPVKKEHLERWLERSSKEMTKWNKQLQGTSSVNFGLSIPMMYMANLGASEGWSHSYTDATTVSSSVSDTFNTTFSTSENLGLSENFTEGLGKTLGSSITDSYSQTHSISEGDSFTVSDGISANESWGTNSSVSQSVTQGNSFSENIGGSQTVGSSDGTSENLSTGQTHSLGNSITDSASQGLSKGETNTSSVTDGTNSSESHTHTDSTTNGTTTSTGGSHTVTNGTTSTTTDGYSNGHTVGNSNGTSQTGTSGYSDSSSETYTYTNNGSHTDSSGTSTNESASGLGEAFKQDLEHDGSDFAKDWIVNKFGAGVSYNNSEGTTTGDSDTTGWGESNGNSNSWTNSQSYSTGKTQTSSTSDTQTDSHSFSTGKTNSTSDGSTWSNSTSHTTGSSDSTGLTTGNSHSETTSKGTSTTVSNTVSQSLGKTESFSDSLTSSTGKTHSDSISQGASWGQNSGSTSSVSKSEMTGTSYSSGTGTSHSESYGKTSSESWGDSQGKSYGKTQSDSYTQSVSNGKTQSWGSSNAVSSGSSYGKTEGQSMGQSLGITGATTTGTSSTMGLGPSMSYSKSYQWLDQEVKNILTLLEFQNQRLMKALRGNGAFFTDVYIGTMDEEARSAASMLAKTAWNNTEALICPLQVLDLEQGEQAHLLYHFAAFSADATKESLDGSMESYKYSTILLPDEFTAYTHLPRLSEGGVYADVEDVPRFAVPSGLTGDIYMGNILSAERYSAANGYETPFEYRLDESELMHAVITGESRSGKTVAALRFISQATKLIRKKTGKRLRIVALDPKQDWRILGKFVEHDRFHFYSLGNPDFQPINLNICKVPHNVNPQTWVDGIIEIYCRNYGLLERGKAILGETFFELYDEAGVFEDSPNWREFVPERSASVTLCKVYERLMKHKLDLEDPTKSKKGRAGNEVRDCYARLTDRMQVFGRKFSIETRLFGQEDGIGIDELIGKDDVIVLESYGLESTFKNFIFGCITSGFFKYAQGHEKGFLADDQYETLMVIEEANEVLCGNDTAGGGQQLSFGGQSEFEKILDQAAGLGLFIFSITQKIADMPSSVVANSGIIFAGKISRAEDTQVVIRKIGREERIDNRDVLKWFPRSPIGWFVCRSSRNYNFLQVEPVLVHVAPLNATPPTNDELTAMLEKKKALQLLSEM